MSARSAHDQLVQLGQLLAVAVGYAASAALAFALAPGAPHATFAWPPLGVGLAALLIGGARLWPAVAVVTFAIGALLLGRPLLAVAGIAAGHTIAVLAGAAVLRRISGSRPSIERLRDVLVLVLVGAASSAVDALLGTSSLVAGAVVPAAGFAGTWVSWCASGLVGVLAFAPMLLVWAERPPAAVRRARLGEAAALGACLLTLAGLVFAVPQANETVVERCLLQPYVLFPPLMWAAVRFHARGAITAMFATAVVATAGTATGGGPFASPDPMTALEGLEVFFAATFLGAIVLGSVASEHARSRGALSSNEALLRAIIEGTTDGIFVQDRLGRCLMGNAAFARAVAAPIEALIGRDASAVLPPDEARQVYELHEEIMRTGRPQTCEVSRTLCGKTRLYQTAKAPYRDGSGEVAGVISVSRDVTEQRSAEIERARLAAIVESSADAIVGESLDGTITSWNAAAERLFGHASGEAIGRPVSTLVSGEAQDEFARLLERARRGERFEGHEIVGRRKEGRPITIAITLSPVRGPAGAVAGTSVIARDLTDTAERLRLALDAAKVGMWFWNLGSDRLSWTPLCRALHGVGPDEELGYARWLEAVHPGDRAAADAAVQRAIADLTDYRIEYRVVCSDGTIRWISARGRVVCDEAGVPARMLGSVLDITSQKQAEAERAELLRREQAALAEARAAASAKDEFLAVLSHELRTPLQAMIGWTHMLKDRLRDPASLEKGLATIERNARTQAQLIEDLLDVSRIVANKLHLSIGRVDLAPVVDAALETAKVAAAARSIRIDAAIDRRAGAVLGDPDRLPQVVINLLTNAIKFSPEGGRVGLRLERTGATARITVEDEGCGISPELLPRVFDRFRQADGATTRRYGGLGLGLAIVRHIVEAHGGTVKAESPGEGRGATFTVTLPLADGEPRAAVAERAGRGRVTLDGVRVLVVDDDADARELVAMVLEEQGAEVRAVGSVRAALEALPWFRPNVLLSDIGMPEEDGFALIRELRARESSLGGHIAALALTAFASPADRERALALGFEAHMPKPASPVELTTAVASLVGR